MDLYPGLYRGVIEDVNDPQKRKRYRVRVLAMHNDETPSEALPWAELALFGGKFFGDIPAYLAGDRVFVMFEGANRRFPVIVGGFMAEVGGVPDAPSEIRSEYDRTQERWIRMDRVGNKIEMSPLPTERWLHLQAGEAEIFLRQNDGAVEIRASSQLQVTAPSVKVDASEEVVATTKKLFAQCDDEASVRCAGTVNIQGADVINIGRYEDPIAGALLPQTSDVVDMRANNNIKQESGGTMDVDAQANITVNTQASAFVEAVTELNLYGQNKAVLRSDSDVEVTAGGKVKVNAQDNVEIESAAAVKVQSTQQIEVTGGTRIAIQANGGNLSIDAQAGNVTINAAGNAEVTATGTGKFEVTGPLSLKSQASVTIEAPILSMKANAQATLDGGALAILKGSLVQIG